MSLKSYPKVWNLGHPAVSDIFLEDVVVQEKVDGSQFSFGVADQADISGVLLMRSKGVEVYAGAKNGLFSQAVNTALTLQPLLIPGRVYRGEVLAKPKHNHLSYSRIPKHGVILFDIQNEHGYFLQPSEVLQEAQRLGLEAVPTFFQGKATLEGLRGLLKMESVLGGVMVEGFVCKNYQRFGQDGHPLFGKHVSEAFKESQSGDWRKQNPTQSDALAILVDLYRTQGRWRKAVERVRDRGNLQNAPQDIGLLIREVIDDTRDECSEEIKNFLFDHFWPKLARRLTGGLPEWYKEALLERQFDPEV